MTQREGQQLVLERRSVPFACIVAAAESVRQLRYNPAPERLVERQMALGGHPFGAGSCHPRPMDASSLQQTRSRWAVMS